MEELRVIIDQKNGVIDFSNFNELKEQLTEYLKEYREIAFTEESKGSGKSIIADLRKLKKAVNDRKIEVKKKYMQPYDEFESKTKELLTLIDEPIQLIDSRIQVFEEERIKERKKLIQEIYDEKSAGLSEYAPLSRIYSDKWENSSTTKKKIGEEVEQVFLGIRIDIESLKLMRVEPDIVQYALEQYQKGSNAVESMRKANEFAELAERRREADERSRAAREAREVKEAQAFREAKIAREAQEAKEAQEAREAQAKNEIQEAQEVQAAKEIQAAREAETAQIGSETEEGFFTQQMFSAPEPDTEETGFELPFVTPSTRRAVYRIVATESEMADMEMYMDSVGIGFERIE